MHLSVNVHIEHPRNFSCQPEGIPCPPGEATHMNMGQILSKQTQGNSTSADFHCLLNNLAAATSSCSSMSGKSFTGNTVSPSLHLLLSHLHRQLQKTHLCSLRYARQGHLSASKTQNSTIGEATVIHSHSYPRCRPWFNLFQTVNISYKFYGLDPAPQGAE